MSLKSINTGLPDFRPEYVPFPENPKIIKIEDLDAYEYIDSQDLNKHIRRFSDSHNLNQFDILLINMNGGKFFANRLLNLQSFRGEIYDIGYHEDGRISKPIPERCKELKVGIFDDVLDKYITGRMIQNVLPDAKLMYMLKKRDVTPDNQTVNCTWAIEVDDKWLLGGGMNGDTEGDGYPKNWGRTKSLIAAKII